MQPEVFGPYILARRIAVGGTAEIFLARRDGAEGFARHVAIKRILPQLAADTQFVQLILDEARLAAHLHHGHIVQIHDVGQIDGHAYIAMEYLPGTDVGRLIRRARKRTRRVVVAHADLELRSRIVKALKALPRRLEIVPAHDADEVARRSAEGPVDLAIVDGRLASLVVDRLSSAHPELLRTVVLGNPRGLPQSATTLVTTDTEPEIIAEMADCCLRAPMPIDIAMQLIRAVADGLDHAHTAVDYAEQPLQIVHRDINPANVLVSKNGTVKLVDFGIARAATSAEGRRKGFVGTYDFMSPEQTTGDDVDARSDLFSLGTLIHELVAGEHPYKGDDMFGTMRAIREDAPPPLDARVPGTPPLLVDIAVRASEKDAADRYPSAEAMLSDLEEVVRRAGINLSPKRLAGYMQILFGDEVKSFGVTTMSMPAVKLDAAGNAVAVRARASVDLVGRPIGDRPSQSGLMPLQKVPTNPPPTMDAVPALVAAGIPHPHAPAVEPAATPDLADLSKVSGPGFQPPSEASAPERALPPATFSPPPLPPGGAEMAAAVALDNAATSVLPDPEMDAAATMAMPRPSAEDAVTMAMSRAPVIDAAATQALHHPAESEAAVTMAMSRPSDDDDEGDGATQVAPPSPEVLAAIAAAGFSAEPRVPPPREPAPVSHEAPAEHIARRLNSGSAVSIDRASFPHRPPSGQMNMVRTPVGARGSLRSLHSVNMDGPPPGRVRSGEGAMRVTLAVVVVALFGLAGFYVWWRMQGG